MKKVCCQRTLMGIAALLLLTIVEHCDSFLIFRTTTTTRRRTSPGPSLLLLAKSNVKHQKRRGSGGGSQPTKSKKKKKKQTQQLKQQPSTSPSETAKQKKKNTDNSSSNNSKPPWQVLSPKEAKKNIQKEKERRALAQQGIQSYHPAQQQPSSSQPLLSSSFLSDADRRLLQWKRFRPAAIGGVRLVGSHLEERLTPASIQLGVPQVAFLGRSNVGKSSLLNRLLSSKGGSGDRARVGKTPGATARVNVYGLEQKTKNNNNDALLLGLVDLPGFGYAKLSKAAQEAVQEAAERYLKVARGELALGLLLVDARRTEVSDDDRAVLAALYDLGLPLLVVATKADKLPSRGGESQQQEQSLEAIRRGLGLPLGQPLAVSSVTGEGIPTLWKIVLEACETHVKEAARAYREDASKGPGSEEEEEENAEVFEDDEDLVYSQGYDWIHDSSSSGNLDAEYGYKSSEEEGEESEYYGYQEGYR